MTLQAIAEDVWGAEAPVSPGPGFRMKTRMTVVRLPTGGLLLHSPVQMDAPLAAAIDGLGTVQHLVAPNLFHHFFLAAARERWPEARLWAPEGLEKKARGVEIDDRLEAAAAWLDCFDVFALGGMPSFREHVFFHRPSSTLIVTDLIFNRPYGYNTVTRFFFRLAGTHGRLAVSRLLKTMIKDRAAFEQSLRPVFELSFERVVLAHGDVLEENAGIRFREALQRG